MDAAAATASTSVAPTAGPPPPVSFAEALRFWLRLGCVSFGGPAGQIAIMHAELVERRRWISERRFLHALNYCMLLPGPEAQQLATYVGWLMHRTAGGIVAGGLFVLPSLAMLIGLSWIYVAFGQLPVIAGLFYGIKPAVTAIVLHAAWRIGKRTLKNPLLWTIALLALLAIAWAHLPFPAIIAAAAAIGWLGGRLAPASFRAGSGGHGAVAGTQAPAWIDDDTPTPPHARYAPSRLAAVLGGGALLWLLPMGALVAWGGASGPLAQMGWFFTKAALLTFGGAYAVLPYVVQGAVGEYHWLGPTQMMDGLALGETTPGPLIMIVAFVGFLGGWGRAVFGPDHLLLAGTVAATLVTWFTFLPSFVFILAGGPLVEATHGDLKVTGPLTAITAAVVGVIVNLALVFGQHVLWPAGPGSALDPVAAALAAAAAFALLKLQRGVIETIVACAAVGLGWHLLAH